MANRIPSRPVSRSLCQMGSKLPFSTRSRCLDTQRDSITAPSGQKPRYPLYPAVAVLLHSNHVPDSDIPKIPATGPSGRLLKGDVLSYLGRIQAEYSADQSRRIQHLAHLDLSNIKIASKVDAKAQPTSPAISIEPPSETTISLPVSLVEVLKVQKRVEDALGVVVPLSTLLARAIDLANDDLPRSEHSKPSANELFDAVLGLKRIPRRSKGSYVPQLTSGDMSSKISTAKKKSSGSSDIVEILSGRSGRAASATVRPSSSTYNPYTLGGNVFSVTVPAGEAKRARTFLERVKTVLQVEPGRLVL